ncbi:hypothetical protein SDC9_185751 [bioreactor metagenome]|uniref:Major facilitator superfamily (MFS) profile domain-containing protein n=1 Tax=bioreactor metagenome TaxID=1076179 RepID=A0A645HGZ3_9ZZZZ
MFWAFRDAVIIFLIDILIYQTTNSEAALGKMYLLSYLISSLAHFIEQRLIKPKRRLISLHVGAAFLFIAVLGLFIKISFTTILIYTILSAFFIPFFWIPVSSASFNVLTLTHEENMRTEYIINRDIALNIGRTTSTVILIILLLYFKHEKVINYFLLFVGSIQFIALYFLKKFDSWCE